MSLLHDSLRYLMLPLKEIDNAIPNTGRVIELGCGEGVIAKFLALKKNREVIGIDINEKRLPKKSSKNLFFLQSDITQYKLKNANGIIISDVLHHLKYKDQNQVLSGAYKSLKKGGVLVIKEIDTSENIRSKLSRFWDFVFYPTDKIYFNNSLTLKNILKNLGFKVSMKRTCRLFPGSTTLFICRKH